MQFRLLGPVEIEVGGEIRPLPRRRERCLLAVLLIDLNRVVSIDRLADLLWDGDPPDRARRILHSHVSRLRMALPGASGRGAGAELATVGDGYRMDVDPAQVDAHRFGSLVDRAAETTDLTDRADHLRQALDLWRGRALDNAASGWLRERLCADLEERRLAATEDLVQTSLALGRQREILPELARIASAYPERESLIELHMRALYLAGRRADALETYARARAYYAEELGLDPGPKLDELHRAILQDRVTVTAPERPPEAPASPPAAVTPRQLPADVAGFTGRTAHLEQLDSLLAYADDDPTAVVISTIAGTAGVGKTALAVHWAHRVADQFPDGQLYVNLRGFDPDATAVTPAAAVRDLLDALQVSPQQIPASLTAQVGLYRSLLAGRRMLIVLDNARDAAQVRPLLPGTPGCVVVVTSRNQLSGLVTTEGAHPLTLDLLTRDEAHAMLARRLGPDRVLAEPDATDEIIIRCTGLPLALALAAARAATYPRFPLRALAADLQGAGGGLDVMTDPDTATDLRTVCSWSYRTLSDQAARLFRLLGLHPGPDLSTSAAASLAGLPVPQTRRLLAELTWAHLVTEGPPGRYAFHDLLRAYAAELAQTVEPAEHRMAALHRALDYYLHTCLGAVPRINPQRILITPPPPAPGVVPDEIADGQQAVSWFAGERHVLRRAVAEAARTGSDRHCWQLAWAMVTYLGRQGFWRDMLAIQQTALQAALRAEDRTGQAYANCFLGASYAYLSRYDDALHPLQQALRLFQELDDHTGQGITHSNLGMVNSRQGRHHDAVHHAAQALAVYRAAGQRLREAGALNNLGVAHGQLGNYQQSIEYCQQALVLCEEYGNDDSQAATLDTLGYAHQHLGSYQQAVDCYQRALALYRRSTDLFKEAEVLTHLGDAHQSAGYLDLASQAWQHALDILQAVDHPDAAGLRERLDRYGSAAW